MEIRKEFNIVRNEHEGQKFGASHVDFNNNGQADSYEPTLRFMTDHRNNPTIAGTEFTPLPRGFNEAVAKYHKTGELELGLNELRENVRFEYKANVFGNEPASKSIDDIFGTQNPDGTLNELTDAKLVINKQGEGKLSVDMNRDFVGYPTNKHIKPWEKGK